MKQLEEQARRLKESIERQGTWDRDRMDHPITTPLSPPYPRPYPTPNPPTDSQPSIQRLKAIFKRPQQPAFAAQPRRPAPKPKAEKAAPKTPAPAAMEAEAPAALAQEQEQEEGVVEMEVDAKKAKGRKPRLVTRVKQSGVKFAAKKQKGAKK